MTGEYPKIILNPEPPHDKMQATTHDPTDFHGLNHLLGLVNVKAFFGIYGSKR